MFVRESDSYRKNTLVKTIVKLQYLMTRFFSETFLCELFLKSETDKELRVNDNDIILTACVKNEDCLQPWLTHYRNLGVTKFFIVDDDSTFDLVHTLTDDDVYIWKPKKGKFRFAKAFWLELLLRTYGIHHWVLTVDADEYLDLEVGNKNTKTLRTLIEDAKAAKLKYYTAFVFDLVPNETYAAAILNGERIPIEGFDSVHYLNETPPAHYIDHPGNKWSYGQSTDLVYKVDSRYHLNKTFDGLRKIPLFYMDKTIHLNQGFHDLIVKGIQRSNTEFLRDDILPMRHYKLYKTQLEIQNVELRNPVDYFHGSNTNLVKLRENLLTVLSNAAMSKNLVKYSDIDTIDTVLKRPK